jgi:hypothetical protein
MDTDRDRSYLIKAMFNGQPLGNFSKCPICKRDDFMEVHECGPAYFCRNDQETRENEVKMYALDPENAAICFLEERFSYYGYPKSMIIFIVDDVSKKEYKFELTVETVPEFCAEQIGYRDIEESEPEEI